MKLCPDGRTDTGADWNSHSLRPVRGYLACPEFKPEPVSYISVSGLAQVSLCNVTGFLSVNVDVEAASNPYIPCQKSGRTLNDPAAVDQVQTLQQPVVCKLPLELWEGPLAFPGFVTKPIGERSAESSWIRIGITLAHSGYTTPCGNAWFSWIGPDVPPLASFIQTWV